jgi:endonuclease/exonuclease/phosphatase family metal-dependent hydrolase
MKLKIATWNLDRPRTSSATRNLRICDALREINADVLILSETHSVIHPGEEYRGCFSSAPLGQYVGRKGEKHEEGESRVTIWSKYESTRTYETSDPLASVCVGIRTSFGGELKVYGTVLGAYGNRDKGFNEDLELQLADWQRLGASGNICIAGDFNTSFADSYYYTKVGRRKINDCFHSLGIDILTRGFDRNIDHIAISKSFSEDACPEAGIWNAPPNKRFSDHRGVWAMFGGSRAIDPSQHP